MSSPLAFSLLDTGQFEKTNPPEAVNRVEDRAQVLVPLPLVSWFVAAQIGFLCGCRWTAGDAVQLLEESLDTNLLNNGVKLRFPHCAVLPGGVHVQETLNNVLILISTNQSVHRLVLPHPSRMYRSVSRLLSAGAEGGGRGPV